MTREDRFWAKVRKTDGCWKWAGHITRSGYGQSRFGAVTTSRYAHRIAYILVRGPVPDGLDLDHLCRNRACVRPEHLEAVDHRTNILRGETTPAENAARTHCVKGHELAGDNLVMEPRSDGRVQRRCRTCRNAKMLRQYHRKKAEQRALSRSGGKAP